MANSWVLSDPIAHSPIGQAPPLSVVSGWLVSAKGSSASVQLSDRSPLAKVVVRAATSSGADVDAAAVELGTGFGRVARRPDGVLVVGSGPGEWLLLGPAGTGGRLASTVPADLPAVDLTHGRALVRLTGAGAAQVLSKVCAIDLRERVTPNGSAFRSAVARVVTDVVRDDLDGVRSYLLHCERSSGQYLFDTLLDAGAEFGIDAAGFE